VTTISAVAQETSRQSLRRAFKVTINLDSIDTQRMRPGLSARVVVKAQTVADALIAPRASLDLTSKQPHAILSNGKTVDIDLGACNAQECVVTRGLEEGQRLGAANG